ncbi:MAG: Queuine tRNA-ribosyltransferase [Microgenomates bacterium OLB22]|nr:MAG: Queuine tRNA-ribosyltransferase [Microgenomates bacterium OLB22]
MKPYFDISSNSSKTRARRGALSSAHGDVQTPAFVTVGTKATIKSLAPEDLSLTGTQYIFVNTYHMVLAPGEEIVQPGWRSSCLFTSK